VTGVQTCALPIFGEDVAGGEELLKRADEALFRAKRSGRNAAELWTS
jgi:PleD family two-component response regulator